MDKHFQMKISINKKHKKIFYNFLGLIFIFLIWFILSNIYNNSLVFIDRYNTLKYNFYGCDFELDNRYYENVINEMLTDQYYNPGSQVILRKYDRPSLLRTGYIANYGKIVNNWKSCYSVSSESFIAILNAACVFEGILVNIVDDSIIIKSFNDFGEQTTEIPLDLAYHEENKNNIVIQMAKKFIKLYRGIVGGEHYNCNADNNVIKIVTEPIKIWENKSIEAPKEYRPLAVDKINMQYDKIDLSTRDVTITINNRKHNFNYKFESYDSKLELLQTFIVISLNIKLNELYL